MFMRTEEAFGIIVREYRNKCMLSQEELAHISKVDRTYVSLLERGKRRPNLESIFKIAKGLNVKPSVLINEVEKLVGLSE